MKTIELIGFPSATMHVARELQANGIQVRVRDCTKPREVNAPIASDVDLVLILSSNGLGGAIREAARICGVDCLAVPYDWSRMRPILESKGILAMGHQPLAKLAEVQKERRCACGRLTVDHGLVPLPDGSVHGEKQCQTPPTPSAPVMVGAKPEEKVATREQKIAWIRALAVKSPEMSPSAIAAALRANFEVGLDVHLVHREVHAARTVPYEPRKYGSRAERSARRQAAEALFEERPMRTFSEVNGVMREKFGVGLAKNELRVLRDRVLRRRVREVRSSVAPKSAPVPPSTLTPWLRELLEGVKAAGADENLHRLTISWEADGSASVEWERRVVRSGKVTL